MAYALIASRSGAGASTFTSSSSDTTGSDLIVVVRVTHQGSIATLSDSETNSYSALTAKSVAGGPHCTIFYKQAPTTNAAHTWTLTGSTIFASLYAFAFSGSTTTPFDVENGAEGAGFASPAQPGSITPSENNELVISGFGFSSSATMSNSALDAILQIDFGPGNNWGGAAGYKIQSTAAAINPGWTWTGIDMAGGVVVASFKAGAGAPPATPRRRTLVGVGS